MRGQDQGDLDRQDISHNKSISGFHTNEAIVMRCQMVRFIQRQDREVRNEMLDKFVECRGAPTGVVRARVDGRNGGSEHVILLHKWVQAECP